MSERLNVDVSREMYDRAHEAVEQGGYPSTSAVVDEALRVWARERDEQTARLREDVARGFAGRMRDWRGADAEMDAWRRRTTEQPE